MIGLTTTGRAGGQKLHQYLWDIAGDVELVNELVHAAQDVEHTDDCKSGNCSKRQLDDVVTRFRAKLAEIIGATDTEPVDKSNAVVTELRPGLFRAWRL